MAQMTMLERVARAIMASALDGEDAEGRTWHAWLPDARAAVEAMREPSNGMMKAFQYAEYHSKEDDRRVPFVRAYGAMIDQILKGEGE